MKRITILVLFLALAFQGAALAEGPMTICKAMASAETVSAAGAYTCTAFPLDRLTGYNSVAFKVTGSGTAKLCYQVAITDKSTAPSDADWFTPTNGNLITGVTSSDGWTEVQAQLLLGSWARYIVRETGGSASVSATVRSCRQ